jgi:hypothetical protein
MQRIPWTKLSKSPSRPTDAIANPATSAMSLWWDRRNSSYPLSNVTLSSFSGCPHWQTYLCVDKATLFSCRIASNRLMALSNVWTAIVDHSILPLNGHWRWLAQRYRTTVIWLMYMADHQALAKEYHRWERAFVVNMNEQLRYPETLWLSWMKTFVESMEHSRISSMNVVSIDSQSRQCCYLRAPRTRVWF